LKAAKELSGSGGNQRLNKLTAMAELVVPRSIPTTLVTSVDLSLFFEGDALAISLVGAPLNLLMNS